MQVVSTKVGGIPEVLPPDLIYLVEPTVPALVEGLETAIADYKKDNIKCLFEANKRISLFYNWFNITRRTEIVYNLARQEKRKTLGEQLANYIRSGVLVYLLVVSLCYIIIQILEILVPRKVSRTLYFFLFIIILFGSLTDDQCFQYIDIAKDYTEMNVIHAHGDGKED